MQEDPAQNSIEPEVTETDIVAGVPEFRDWLPETLQPYWDALGASPLVTAVLVAVIAYLLAKIVEALVCRGIAQLTRRTETEVDDEIIRLLRKPVMNTVFLFGLSVATRALQLSESVTNATIGILISVIVISWMMAGFPITNLLLEALGRNHARFPIVEERTIPLFTITAKLTLVLVGSYFLLDIWGIDATAWLASAGIVGIAVGFAAKDTLANLFSGFFIVADAPYKLGDFINLDTGERGKVTHVGMRSTRLLTRDDIEITVPNAVIANAKIINESGGPHVKERIRIKIGVAYGSDVDEVCKVLQATAEEHTGVCRFPTARVRMRSFGASSLDFELLAWITQPVDRGRISHELNMAVYKALRAHNIEIPYAKSDVYIKEMPKG